MGRMKLKEIMAILEAEELFGDFNGDFKGDFKGDFMEKEVTMACASDLMSDVLAFAKSGTLLLTGLVNPQVIRTAELSEIAAICFVRGKKPQKDAVDLARRKEIPLLATHYSMFEACGRLYQEGLRGCDGK